MATATSAHTTGTALVTGASSGMGAEFARQLAADGWSLVVTGQNPDRVAAIEQEVGATLAVRVDLSEPGGAASLMRQIDDAGLEIDLLVNNAGLTSFGAFASRDLDTQLDMIRVNVLALTELTGLLLPGMVARRSGAILNVASSAAYAPGPLQSVYYATKAYVLSFSEGLAEELKGTGVTVTALTPGPVRTRFEERGEMTRNRMFNSRFVQVADPAAVARAGLEGVRKGKRTVAPDLSTRLSIVSTRFLPRTVLARLVGWLHAG